MDFVPRNLHDDVMTTRRHAAITLMVMSAVMLTGCAQSGGYADLEGERDAADRLPELEEYAYESLDASTSRYIGEYDGTSLWLAKGVEGAPVCLVSQRGAEWIVGCGGRVGGATGTFEVFPDGASIPEDATRVSENVYAW